MYRKTFSDMNCSIARSLEEVGEWWSLLIVRECTQGATRFDEFQKNLGIARNVLTARLERLIELGILERFPLEDLPSLNGYRLTEKGEALYPVLVALWQWGDRWLVPEAKVPTRLVVDATGEQIAPLAVRGKSGEPLSFRDVRFAPGPGATEKTHAVIDDRNERVLGQA
jgi:DNA-binding HxlR family transcriptional regulator